MLADLVEWEVLLSLMVFYFAYLLIFETFINKIILAETFYVGFVSYCTFIECLLYKAFLHLKTYSGIWKYIT